MAMTNSSTPSRPDPDPTVLTTAALLREISSIKELFGVQIDALDQRIAGLHAHIDSLPHEREAHITSLKEWVVERFATMEEKFHSVQTQFTERDVRVEQTAKDSKVAVDAALQAAKEAVGEQNKSFSLSIAKSETATVKQIDAQGTILSTSTAALNDKIEDLKARVTTVEGMAVGRHESAVTSDTHSTSLVASIGLGVAIVFGLLSLILTAWHMVATR